MFSLAILASCLAILPAIVAGHGKNPGLPQVFGLGAEGNQMKKHVHRSRHIDGRLSSRNVPVKKRQSTNRCGSGVSCVYGLCCSRSGYCGTGEEYCPAPDCQLRYGPACDGNKIPGGAGTSSIARPHVGKVPYGGPGIYQCLVCTRLSSLAFLY